MTVIPHNVKHSVLPCVLRTILFLQNTKSSRMAASLLSCLGATMSLVYATCITEAQHSPLSMEGQKKKGSTVGRHHHLAVLVCDFMMVKAQWSFFLIRKSQYAENRSHKVLVYCVTLFHLHFSITHSRLAWKVTHSAGCLGKTDCFHLQRGLQQSTFKMTL